MKYLNQTTTICFVMFFLAISGKSLAQQESDSTSRADTIIRIEQKLLDGIATGDTALWDSYLAKDFTLVDEDGYRSSREQFLSSLKPLPDYSSGYIKIASPHVSLSGDVAALSYVADEHETVYGQTLHTTYGTLTVYARSRDAWRVLTTQTFEIPQYPPSVPVSGQILRLYSGDYYIKPGVVCHITQKNNQLFMSKGKSVDSLFAETSSVFFRKRGARTRILFYKTPENKWVMWERRNGQDLAWIKQG